MGTPWRLVVYATDSLAGEFAIARVREQVATIERIASDYRPDSEINRLVGLPPGIFHSVSADLYELLTISRQLAERSGGAFDPTVGPLTKLWRRAIRQQTFPDSSSLRRARTRVQYGRIHLGLDTTVKVDRPNLRIDLGGIAKGYALDAAGEVLRKLAINRFLIDGGGDLLLGLPPPGEPGWTVRTPAGILSASQTSVAVSGARYRYLDHGGRRYSHIVDPRTGLGVSHFATVTVIGPRATLADGLASAISVLGRRGSEDLLRAYPAYRMKWEELPSPP
jgi:thiamine biosynthesis lipoprotein